MFSNWEGFFLLSWSTIPPLLPFSPTGTHFMNSNKNLISISAFDNPVRFFFFPFLCLAFQDNARQKYTELVSSLVSAESASQKKDSSPEQSGYGGYETILVTTKNNITKIMFNRPDRKNAINQKVKKLTWEDSWFLISWINWLNF